jgi:hypothetical protein
MRTNTTTPAGRVTVERKRGGLWAWTPVGDPTHYVPGFLSLAAAIADAQRACGATVAIIPSEAQP